MKLLLMVIVLAGIVYGGWVIVDQQSALKTTTDMLNSTAPTLSLQDPNASFSSIGNVLGIAISNSAESISSVVNTITGGASEPLINQTIANMQSELAKLPEDQVKKIQYNYCRSIVEEYEKVQQ
jgi:hypothetical protein